MVPIAPPCVQLLHQLFSVLANKSCTVSLSETPPHYFFTGTLNKSAALFKRFISAVSRKYLLVFYWSRFLFNLLLGFFYLLFCILLVLSWCALVSQSIFTSLCCVSQSLVKHFELHPPCCWNVLYGCTCFALHKQTVFLLNNHRTLYLQ